MRSCSPWTLVTSPLKSGRHKNSGKTSTSSTPARSSNILKRGRNESNTSLSTTSSLNTSGRTFQKFEYGSDSETSLAATQATEYRAPYHRLPFVLANPRADLIYFREGHTLEKHLQAIGRTKDDFRGQFQSFIVSRWMNEEELERVRRDPGVEKVVQVTDEMEEVARSKDRYVELSVERAIAAKKYGFCRKINVAQNCGQGLWPERTCTGLHGLVLQDPNLTEDTLSTHSAEIRHCG